MNHLGINSYIVGSVNCPPICDNDLLLIASSSGETPTIREIARIAQEKGTKIALITASPDSTIGKIASLYIKIEAPASLENEEKDGLVSRQPMKTLFEQTLFIFCESMVLMLIQRMKQSMDQLTSRHANLE